jgi:hypothetical protein
MSQEKVEALALGGPSLGLTGRAFARLDHA